MFKVINKGVSDRREFRTRDIVKRLSVITADRVEITNHPLSRPTTVFNPAVLIRDDSVKLYARIVVGYFTYASAIAEFSLSLADIYSQNTRKFSAELTVFPEMRYDFWGVEDPRVYEIDGKLLMTYCGRTVNYFNPAIRTERTLPVTAIFESGKWRKICVFRAPKEMRGFVISDKDAFLVRGKEMLLFHRIHSMDESFYLNISRVPEDVLELKEIAEVIVNDTITVFEPAKFELKLGWSTPPVEIDREYMLLIHGVDVDRQCYRIFAILLNENNEVTATTPFYIMEPRENYEIYGDRPYTIFPCGIQRIDDHIIISYGAADSVVGFGEIDLSELMSILDKNRLE